MINLTLVISFVAGFNTLPVESVTAEKAIGAPTYEIQRGGGFVPPTKKTED